MDFYHLQESIIELNNIIENNYWIRTRSFKDFFQKIVHKAGEFLGNKIADILTE